MIAMIAKPRTLIAALWAVAMAQAMPAQAQGANPLDLNLDDLLAIKVTSASKFEQSSREAPSAVEVVSREDIRRHGWRTLSDALSSLTGVYAVTDRAYDFVGARGFLVPGDYNTRFLLLVDGQRSNDNVYEEGAFGDSFPLDLALVERIEYVPGPGSAIYGSNAIFGTINVITRRTEEMPPALLSGRLGSDGWREGSATLARRFESGASLLVSFSEGNKRGSDLTYADAAAVLTVAGGGLSPDGIARNLDRARKRQLFARIEDGGLSLALRYGERSVQPSSALYATLFNDPGLRVDDRYLSVVGRYQRQVREDLGIEARLEFGEMGYRGDYPYDDGAGNRYINRDETLGRWWAGDLRGNYTGIAGHKLVAGIEMQSDVTNRQRNFDVDAAINPALEVDSRRHRRGLYLLDEWTVAEKWRLNAGLRHDSFSDQAGRISPRLGLIWLASADTSFKLLGGQAYRVPNTYERDYANGVSYLGNPNLKPESIRTLEAVWEQRFGARQSLRVTLFDYRLTELIAQVDTGGGLLQYQNQPKVKALGAEAAWHAGWESGAQLDASLGINQTEDSSGRRPGFSPRWVGKLRGSLPLPGERWLVAAEARAWAATTWDWMGAPQTLPSRVLVDLSLTDARSQPGLSGLVRIRNLFDRHHAEPGSGEAPVATVPGSRRRLEAVLRYAF